MKFYRLFLVLVAAPLSLLWLAAGTAQATSVDLIFMPAGTITIGPAGVNPSVTSPLVTCSGGTPGARPGTIVNGVCDSFSNGDQLVFAVGFNVDANGVNAWSVDLDWDTGLQNSLTLDGVTRVTSFYRGFQNPSPPPAMIGYSPYNYGAVSQQSSPTQGGYVHNVSGGLTQDFALTIANTSFRASTVTFTVNGTAGTEIALGFFRTDGADMGNSASQFITPSFGVFQIGSVPEPGTSLLMGAGLFGLLIAGRSSRIRSSVAAGLREVHDQRKHRQ